MTRILKESNIIKQSIVDRITNGSNYPYLYSVIQFGFYDNQGFLLPPSLIRQYWDKEEVKRTCRMIYNLLKEVNQDVQNEGWQFNIEYHIKENVATSDNKIIIGFCINRFLEERTMFKRY